MKRLKDGETKEIKASRDWSMFKHRSFKVEAERYDCDTPFVNLTIDCITQTHISMTDVETLDLIDRLQRALSVLPTSK